ncbi:MAG TPA: MarR family transcriptional regulator [Novosphingobium sp.]
MTERSTEPSAPDLLLKLLKLGSFVSGPMRDGVCEPAGLALADLRALMALAGEGPLAGHDLVEITGLTAMNISRVLAGLRERGWIEDAVDPDNRRRKPVTLTPAGEAAYRATLPDFEQVAEALLERLSARDRRSLGRLTDLVVGELVRWIHAHHAGVKLHG